MSLTMIYLAIKTSAQSNLSQLPPGVLNEPWFKTTLIDFYFNIVIISTWVIYKEHNWIKAFFWIFAFVALGSIATSFYVLRQFLKLKEGEGLEAVLLKKEHS